VAVQSIDDPGFFGIGIILILLLDSLHEFVQLANLLICVPSAHVRRICSNVHTTHFINLPLVHLVAFPRVALEGLGV
jgi:hypothetical protein